MAARIVVDTSVFTAALIGHEGSNREILRRCLLGRYQPLLGNALFSEYEEGIRIVTPKAVLAGE